MTYDILLGETVSAADVSSLFWDAASDGRMTALLLLCAVFVGIPALRKIAAE